MAVQSLTGKNGGRGEGDGGGGGHQGSGSGAVIQERLGLFIGVLDMRWKSSLPVIRKPWTDKHAFIAGR